jgi:hypothetical protein
MEAYKCALELKMNIYVKWRMKIMNLFLVEYMIKIYSVFLHLIKIKLKLVNHQLSI